MHTTNYVDTFIAVASDSTAEAGSRPRSAATVAGRTYELIADRPYRLTSDDVIFGVWADRQGIADADRDAARAEFFSTGQACLRASDLAKRYGWGVHSDADGRVALYGVETAEYASLAAGTAPDGTPVTVVKAMRSRRP